MSWALIKGWLAKAAGYLVTAAIAIPALAALYLWGKSWRAKAKASERGRIAAQAAADAATHRADVDRRIQRVESAAREQLAVRVQVQQETIAEQESELDAIVSDADRFNRALVLGQTVGLNADDDS